MTIKEKLKKEIDLIDDRFLNKVARAVEDARIMQSVEHDYKIWLRSRRSDDDDLMPDRSGYRRRRRRW